MTTPTIEDTYRELERTSEVINDHLWYVNPEKLRTALTTIDQNARESRDKEWMEIVTWLTGEEGDFPSCPDGARYCWRTELRKKVEALFHPLNK